MNLQRKLKKAANTQDVIDVIGELIDVVDDLNQKVETLEEDLQKAEAIIEDGKEGKKGRFFQFGDGED